MMRVIKIFLSALMFIYGHSAAAARGELNPLGSRGSGSSHPAAGLSGGSPIPQWKDSWSQAYFQCAEKDEDIKKMFEKMSNGEVSDIGPGRPWCPNSDVFRPENIRLFQLATLKLLAKPESGYRPHAINPNSPNPPAVGLFQIGPSDVKFHQCKKPDGSAMSSVADLKVAENNVCCAAKIAARAALDKWKGAAKGQSGKLVFAEGKKGIMGRFWEPMRVQNTKGAKGEKMRAEINKTCNSFNAGGTFTVAEVDSARRAPASSSSNSQVAGINNGTSTR